MLVQSYILTFILVILYLTDALPLYLNIFWYNKSEKCFYKTYFEEKARTISYFPENFLEYLSFKHPKSFMLELLACPFCITFWLSAICFCWVSCHVLFIPMVYVQTLLMFFAIKYLSKNSSNIIKQINT